MIIPETWEAEAGRKAGIWEAEEAGSQEQVTERQPGTCLLYTADAADE